MFGNKIPISLFLIYVCGAGANRGGRGRGGADAGAGVPVADPGVSSSSFPSWSTHASCTQVLPSAPHLATTCIRPLRPP